MKKIINYFKNLIRKFTFQQKKYERYILNNMYREDAELMKFVQERKRTLGKSSISFVITWIDFPDDLYGEVELVWNNKVVERAKLIHGEHNLYWIFYKTEKYEMFKPIKP